MKLGSIELSERSRFMVQKVGSKPGLDASFTPPGVPSLGGAEGAMAPQILADQLTLSQGGTNYANLISTGTPGFSDLPTTLLPS